MGSQVRAALATAAKMIRTPEITFQIGQAMVRKRLSLKRDMRREDGLSAPFDLLHIKLVNACNLRCKMCAQWGENGFHFNQPPSYLKELVPLESHFRLIDDVASFRPWVCLSGGEVFLHPEAINLISYIKKKGLTLTVATNGLSLTEHAARLVDVGVDFVYVSLEGAESMHDEIRGLSGAFEKTTAGIRAVQAYKRIKRCVKPYVIVSAAVTVQNAATFDDVFHVAEDCGADGLVASYGWFQTKESCESHDRIMATELGTFPISHRGWLWTYSKLDAASLAESVRRVNARSWSFPYAFLPKLTLDEIPRYYTEHQRTFNGVDHCVCPWYVVQILPNGDVATCVDLPDFIAGNIGKERILDIWANERYRKFRHVLKDHKFFPACTRCSGMIGRGL